MKPPAKTPAPRRAATVGAYFDARAPGYRAATARGLWAWLRRREAAAVMALTGNPDGLSVLDLGCGAGFYADLLANQGARPVVAVDASAPMLAAIADPRIEKRVGDAATVALDQRFDRIILAGLLEFVEDDAAVMRNARRHLADGGRIVALFPPDGAASQLYRLFHRSHGVSITLFSPDRIDALADAAGLRRISQRPVWPLALVCALEAR